MYNAFISYSQAADGRLAPALQTALESAVGTEERLWSVSVVDQRGQLLLIDSPAAFGGVVDGLAYLQRAGRDDGTIQAVEVETGVLPSEP